MRPRVTAPVLALTMAEPRPPRKSHPAWRIRAPIEPGRPVALPSVLATFEARWEPFTRSAGLAGAAHTRQPPDFKTRPWAHVASRSGSYAVST